MNKIFSFMAGALCGALIGGVTALLLTPNSGEQLRMDVRERLETAVSEAQKAMAEKEAELDAQFEQMKNG